MILIKIYIPKIKEQWVQLAFNEYIKRMKAQVEIELVFYKDLKALQEKQLWLLDPKGNHYTSENFAKALQEAIQKNGSRLNFLIGPADGLPASFKQGKELLSLSEMTFPHEMAGVVLIEQIYRAIEIMKGSPYHKA